MYKEYPRFYNYETIDYGRKSRTDDPLLSVEEVLEKHDKILDEYAKAHLGGPIPEENKYREVGSGESIDSRPEMLRVLKAIENPSIKAIMVVDVQRLSRGDLEDAGRLIKLLRYTNTYVITPHKTYDLRDEYDRDAFERELKRGNEYLEYFKKIQARGKLASVRDGNFVGSTAPYGFYKVKKENGNKVCHTLKENKEEADVIRMIFDWYCNEDIGVTAICRRLEALGVKTRKDSKIWKPVTIFNILDNVHYIGCVRWNWRKVVKIIEDQEVRKTRPKPDEYLVFEGKHDGIISRELFEKAQRIKGQRHRSNTDKTLKNPLSGLLFCKACGARMTYNTYRKKGAEYSPPKLHCVNQVHCKSGSVYFEEVMNHLCDVLRDCIADFEVRIKSEKDNSQKLHKDLVDRLREKMKALEEKEVLQWEAQYDPDPEKRMPMEIFKTLNKKLLEEKEEVRKALCKAEESMPQPVDYKEKILSFRDALRILKDPNVQAKTKNQYLRNIIERMDYERPSAIRITNKNAHLYPEDVVKGMSYHWEPYKISISLKS